MKLLRGEFAATVTVLAPPLVPIYVAGVEWNLDFAQEKELESRFTTAH